MKRHLAAVTVVATGLVGVSWVGAQDPKAGPTTPATKPVPLDPFPAGYLDHDGLTKALKATAEAHPKAVRLGSLARTREGRDVWMATIGHRPEGDRSRPAVLVVANLEADHLAGTEVAVGLIRGMAEADGKDEAVAKLLDQVTIHVVPRLNPDGAERMIKRVPRVDLRTNLTPIDRDRDGKAGEDGPNDLDGDGRALTIRSADPAKATHLPDSKDPRVLRKADPAKGERAVVSERTEGFDDDGDGQIDEDPPGGVDLNRNWPHGWTEYDPEAGVSPASEPEVNALIRFAFDHPEIVAVWTLSLNDNLRSEARGLAPADAPYHADLARAFTKAIGGTGPGPSPPTDTPKAEPAKAEPTEPAKAEPTKKAATKGQGQGRGGAGAGAGAGTVTPPGPTPASPSARTEGTNDGAMSAWAYHQFGVIGLASKPWAGPDLPGGPTLTGEGEARWLDWNDKAVGGSAFIGFHPVEHPTLGKVEVGGWTPGARLNPPATALGPIVAAHLDFLKDLAGRAPTLAIEGVEVSARGGGVFEVKARVENRGYLPTGLAQGLTTRKAPPVLVRLDLGATKLLAGRPLERIDTLAGSGGHREFRWLVLAPGGGSITLGASCPKAGQARREIPLR